MKFLCVVAVIIGLLLPVSVAANNPFTTPSSGTDRAAVDRTVTQSSDNVTPHPLYLLISSLQRDLRRQMTDLAAEIRENPAGTTTIKFLLLVAVFGAVHALGPGHGKAFVCAWFLAHKGGIRKALMFGHLITFMHVLSATLLVLLMLWLGRQLSFAGFQQWEGGIQQFSFMLIILIGAFLLLRTLYDIAKGWRTPDTANQESTPASGSFSALALTAGMIPCPGAALILLFSSSLGIFWLGLVAMPVLALGMGATNSMVGIATIGSRNAILKLTCGSPIIWRYTWQLLALCGSSIVLLLGIVLYTGGLSAAF